VVGVLACGVLLPRFVRYDARTVNAIDAAAGTAS
jgi:hypothetical protein